jgi:peptidoglycan/xylan/chitin deacetylase (PgdA/CDA1 family)
MREAFRHEAVTGRRAVKKHIRLTAILLILLLFLPLSGAFAETGLSPTGGEEPASGQPSATPDVQNTGTTLNSGTAAEQSAAPAASPTPTNSAVPAAGSGAKYIALTFDDGPNSGNTPKLLDMLAKYDVHATFFVLGWRIKGNESLLRRMAEEGHEIGNHSYDHKRYTSLKDSAIEDQLRRTNELIYAACGVTPTLARPPYGSKNAKVLKCFEEMGFACVTWSIDPEDWNSTNAKSICSHVVSRARNGSIVLMHDIRKTSVAAAEMIIKTLKAQGYTFVTVSELFGGKLTSGSVYKHA